MPLDIEAFYREHYRMVFGYLLSLCGNYNSGESENVNTGFNFTQEKVEFIDEEQIVHNCTIN